MKQIDESNPYELIKLLILKPLDFLKLSDKTKNYSFFLLNRILSQQYPEIANRFNVNGIYPATCMEFYAQLFLLKRYNRIPGWVYTKFASKHKKSSSLDKDFVKYLIGLEYNKDEIQFLNEYEKPLLKSLKKKYNEIQANT